MEKLLHVTYSMRRCRLVEKKMICSYRIFNLSWYKILHNQLVCIYRVNNKQNKVTVRTRWLKQSACFIARDFLLQWISMGIHILTKKTTSVFLIAVLLLLFFVYLQCGRLDLYSYYPQKMFTTSESIEKNNRFCDIQIQVAFKTWYLSDLSIF